MTGLHFQQAETQRVKELQEENGHVITGWSQEGKRNKCSHSLSAMETVRLFIIIRIRIFIYY